MTNPAQIYESYMVPVLFGPWATHLIECADPQPGQRILDVACGTGIVARQIAARLGPQAQVTGLDLNPQMLAVAQSTAAQQGLTIDWREGRAEQLPFARDSFDVVLCQFGLMFFSDRPAALAEIHRVLKPAGRLYLNTWQGLDRHPFYATLHRVIQQRIGESALQSIFALGDADELRRLLRAAGFESVAINARSQLARFPNPEGFLAGEIAVDTAAIPTMQTLDATARQAILEAISSDMQAPLKQVTQLDHVVLEFHAQVARAERSPAANL